MGVEVMIADYGVGNLHSIRKALEICGADAKVVKNIEHLLEGECLVFPGVGAFSRTMKELMSYRNEITERLEEGLPALGICIGAQILFEESEEGSRPGLGFIEGGVKKLDAEKVPHMGWNSVQTEDPIFDSIDSKYFYFAHSYYGSPKEEEVKIGNTNYYHEFPSLFKRRNTFGTQFHPEKSSESGMRFLKNFVKFAEGCL